MRKALIIGATGLTGSKLLDLLLQCPEYDKVVAFTKRPLSFTHEKLEQHIIDFDNLNAIKHLIKGDDFFCTIGTTIKKAGSQEAFKKVDYTYPRAFALLAQENNVGQFLIITSIGANENSKNFYLRTKGQIEAFLRQVPFKSVAVLQPSLLLGNRGEFRLAEKMGAAISKVLSFFLVCRLKKYKPIKSDVVAQAMINIALQNHKGFRIYPSDQIKKQALTYIPHKIKPNN